MSIDEATPEEWNAVHAYLNEADRAVSSDPVNHPTHYTNHPSGIEAIEITKHEDFCIGNALKYILRHKSKGKPVEDLRKAIWYLQTKIDMYVQGEEDC